MTKPPCVSIVVPVYNLERYIGECLTSLALQATEFSFEVIVVDDHSTDSSWSVIKGVKSEYPEIIRPFRNEKNLGLALTMAKLMELSRGEFIAYLDGDDVALPGKIQSLARHLKKNDQCTMVYHEMEVFDSETRSVNGYYVKDYYNRHLIPERPSVEDLIRFGCFMHIGGVMVRAPADRKKTADLRNKIILDHPWLVLCLLHNPGRVDFLDSVLGQYRIHSSSFGALNRSNLDRKMKVLDEQLHVCSLAAEHGVSENVVIAGERHYHYAAALFYLKIGSFDRFSSLIEKTTDGIWFLDGKHRAIHTNRTAPDQIRKTFFAESS